MDFRATKDHQERHDDEAERLVRPSPKYKPPRHDLRRERVQPDADPDSGDVSDAKDRSKNFKNIGGSLRDRLVSAAKDRIPAKNRETGDTVMISPDTLKEEPGKYEVVDREDKKPKAPEKPEEPEESSGEGTPQTQSKKERDAHYRGLGKKLRGLAKGDSKLESKFNDFAIQHSQLAGIAKENPDVPAARFFPGLELPKGLKTLGDVSEALAQSRNLPSEEGAEKKPKKKKCPGKKKKAPKTEESTEGEEAKEPESGEPETQEEPEDSDESDEGEEPSEEAPKPPKEPTESEKAGIAEPKRRAVNRAEREEAMGLIIDTFPASISADLIAKNLHPDDVRSLVQDYSSAKEAGKGKNVDDVIARSSTFFQTDPAKVPPPVVGKNENGETVSFDQLTPEEQSEAMRKHQLRVTAMSLAAQDIVTDKLSSRGDLTGKDRIPRKLAMSLAKTILHQIPDTEADNVAAKTFDSVIESGSLDNISDTSARKLLSQVKGHPAAQAAARAYLQANDYALAKQKFLKGDDESLSEWQTPEELLKGLKKAGQFFDERSGLYGDKGESHPASTFFRSRVMSRLMALDPKKARIVQAKLPKLEEEEYKSRHHEWEARYRDWAEKDIAHDKAMEKYLKNPLRVKPPGPFTEREPVEPKPPVSLAPKDEEDIWDSQFGLSQIPKNKPKYEKPEKPVPEVPEETPEDQKAIDEATDEALKNPLKLARDFTYLSSPVMGSATKIGVYHGVDPYAYGPPVYPGWLQPKQRDFGTSDFEAILKLAKDWLKSPILLVATDEMVPDAKFRAALDLAIYDSPYNGAINASQYNEILAKLQGVPEPGQGETLMTLQKAASDFKTETRYLVFYGPGSVGREILASLEGVKFAFTDEMGVVQENGSVGARVLASCTKTASGMVPETVVRVDFPEGAEQAALKSIQAALAQFRFQAEKTTPGHLPELRASTFSPPGDSTMKASQEIRKLATQATSSSPSKIAFELLALADRVAEEEKKMPPWLKDKFEKGDEGKDKEQKKEASDKVSSLRALIIKQASSLDAQSRAPWLPVLQALKDLG